MIAGLIARCRRWQHDRFQDRTLLLEWLVDQAFQSALAGREAEARAAVEEGFRHRPTPAFIEQIGRLAHLCRGYERDGLHWMDRASEWATHLPQAYRALFLARLGHRVDPPAAFSPETRLLRAETLLWLDREEEAEPLLAELLRGRSLDENYRHVAYVMMIDCQTNLGRPAEARRWTERERRWCRRHGRTPMGSPETPAVEAAQWVLATATRRPPPPRQTLRLNLLRQAYEDPGSQTGLCLRVCRCQSLLDTHALEALHPPANFIRLFRKHLPVGPLVLALPDAPEVMLDDPDLGPYAQRVVKSPKRSTPRAALIRADERLLDDPLLAAPTALGLADRGRTDTLPRLRRLATDPWIALAVAALETGHTFTGDWRLDYRGDPSTGRYRLLPHPIEDLLRGYPPLELHDALDRPPDEMIVTAATRLAPPAPDVQAELEQWTQAGAEGLWEIHTVLEYADRIENLPVDRRFAAGLRARLRREFKTGFGTG